MELINNIEKQIQNHHQLKHLDQGNKIVLTRELIFQQVNERIKQFEKCLDEINLTPSYPYLDPSRYYILNKIFKFNFRSFPINYNEEIKMRNCVRKYVSKRMKVKEIINLNN